MHGNRVRSGVTLPLGSLALQDLSHQIPEARRAHREERVVRVAQLKAGRGCTFYAVGGTWRALGAHPISCKAIIP